MTNLKDLAKDYIVLSDYIDAEYFRTVLENQLTILPAKKEYKVEMDITEVFWEKFGTKLSWNGKVYGYVWTNENLIQMFEKADELSSEKGKIFLNDWGDFFIIIFESGSKKTEKFYKVTTEDVLHLLNNCRKA